ncbi:hypothetical protein C8J56DRAFT_941262 [Mycena floridula]|nr:hypothetical protein C8J56DRAFT_941262 [Mycena floridula]
MMEPEVTPMTPPAPRTTAIIISSSRKVSAFTPPVQSYYRGQDGNFYSNVHDDQTVYEDDEEQYPGQTYQQPTKYFYPNAHPDLQSFLRSSSPESITQDSSPSALGKRKTSPLTPAAETTIQIKQAKISSSGSRGRVRAADFECAYPERTQDSQDATNAFVEACKKRGVEIEISDAILRLIQARATQGRGECKTLLRPLVAPTFGLTATNTARQNRDKVEDILTGFGFLYKDTELRTGFLQAPIIQTAINTMWFKHKNDVGPSSSLFSVDGGLPLPAVALALTTIECCLDEWQSGEHVNVQFTANVYQEKYEAHLKTLKAFHARTKDANIIPKMCVRLLKNARKHAKIVDTVAAHVMQLDDLDLEAAMKDWANVNSDDDEE